MRKADLFIHHSVHRQFPMPRAAPFTKTTFLSSVKGTNLAKFVIVTPFNYGVDERAGLNRPK